MWVEHGGLRENGCLGEAGLSCTTGRRMGPPAPRDRFAMAGTGPADCGNQIADEMGAVKRQGVL